MTKKIVAEMRLKVSTALSGFFMAAAAAAGAASVWAIAGFPHQVEQQWQIADEGK